MSPERFKHYVIGLEKFDEEHFSLFELAEAAVNETEKDKALEALNVFKATWVVHSSSEYRFMHEIGFPFLDLHIEEHNRIAESVEAAYREILDLGVPEYSYKSPILPILEDILYHLDHFDLQYADFARAKGILPKVL